jgi:hypothetical protein
MRRTEQRVFLAAAVLASASLAQAALVSSQTARFADGGGLLDRYAGAGWKAIGFGDDVTGLACPDGGDGFDQQQLLDLRQGFTASEVDAWLQPSIGGNWTITREDGSTEQFDTSSRYRGAAQRPYATLTEASNALWNEIVSQQVSGTFTFEMNQTVAELGCTAVQFQTFGGMKTILSGRSFTVDIDGLAASQGGLLLLSGFGPRGSVIGTLGTEVAVEDGFMTIYSTAIPGPGALVIAGLAGALAPRRRR